MNMCPCKTILTLSLELSGDDLILVLPEKVFNNNHRYLIRIAQDIPAEVNRLTRVFIAIKGDSTNYPVIRYNGHFLYASQVRTRRNYLIQTAADTGAFMLINGWVCGDNNGSVPTIPAPVFVEKGKGKGDEK